MSLKYTFEAVFNDGTNYHQRPDDSSQDSGASAWADIASRLDDVLLFSLWDRAAEKLVASVNPKSGMFLVSAGYAFKASEPIKIELGDQIKLVYFRRNTVTLCAGVDGRHAQASSTPIEYHIGIEVNGQRQTIALT